MPDSDGLTDPAVLAVIQTTQIDHERRIAQLEERSEKNRELFEARFGAISNRISDSFNTLNGKIDDKVKELYGWIDAKNEKVMTLVETLRVEIAKTGDRAATGQLRLTLWAAGAIIVGLTTLATVLFSAVKGH